MYSPRLLVIPVIVYTIRDTRQAVQTSLVQQQGTDVKAAPGRAQRGLVVSRAGPTWGLEERGADRGPGTRGAGPAVSGAGARA